MDSYGDPRIFLAIFKKADHSLRYESALKFAEISGAQTLQFDSDCGHLVTVYEHEKINHVKV